MKYYETVNFTIAKSRANKCAIHNGAAFPI